MAIKFGIDGKLYFCTAGIGGTPTWTLIPTVKSVTLGLTAGESDVTTRINGRWKATAPVLKDASIEFEMPNDPAAVGFAELRSAWLNGTVIGLAVMDGPVATAGSEGLWADCSILDFSRDESLEEAMKIKVTAKPGYSANAPQWKVVGDTVQQSTFSLALVGGAGAIDLTDLPGDVDGTGQKVTVLRVTNNGANALTISKAVANGYGLLGGDGDVVVDPGATVTLTLTASDTVASDCKALTLAGTGTQSAAYEITLETP